MLALVTCKNVWHLKNDLFSVMSVKRLNFHHMSHLRLPSAASRSTRDWSSYTDSADVPSIVLMENMERDGAEIIFAAFKNFNNILDSVIAHKRKRLNSLVAMVTMRTEHVPLLPEPVKVTFKHLSDSLEQNRECAHWEAHFFSTRGCRLLETNLTHTRCACSHFGLIALIEDEQQQVVKTSEASTTHVTLVVSVVIATIVVFCLIVSLAIGLDYCRRIRQVRSALTRHHYYSLFPYSLSIIKEPESPLDLAAGAGI